MKNNKRKINEFLRDGLYSILNITPRHNLEKFFKSVGLKNAEGVYPIQSKIIDGEKGDIYFIKTPRHLKFEDFIKYQVKLEKYYGSSVEMNWDNNFLTIEMYNHGQKYNLERFFMNAGLKNKSNHYPKQIKILEGEILDGKIKKHAICLFQMD